RASDFRFISARHSDMVHPRGGADAPGRQLPGRGKIFSNGAASSISPPIRALFVWVDAELAELPKSAPDSMLVHFLSESRFPLVRKMPRHRRRRADACFVLKHHSDAGMLGSRIARFGERPDGKMTTCGRGRACSPMPSANSCSSDGSRIS